MPRARPGYKSALHLVEYFQETGAGTVPERLDLGAVVFTPSMVKRPGQGPFDAAPIIQGPADSSTNGDSVSAASTIIGNPVSAYFKTLMDVTQGTIILWWTPEFSSGGSYTDTAIFYLWSGAGGYFRYNYSTGQFQLRMGASDAAASSTVAVTSGTTYLVTASWDAKQTIDGTNYKRLSVNNSHVYVDSSVWSIDTPDSTERIGSLSGGDAPAQGIIEGLTVYRRVLSDSNGYGTLPLDGSDELTAIYAAGAGADPSQVVGGSWDTVFCIPTDSDGGALVTGTGEAWSHPHGSELPDVAFMSDGDPPGTPYAVEFNGTSTIINCGNDPTIDDIPAGGNELTVDIWFRYDDLTADFSYLIHKGVQGSTGWFMRMTSGDVLQWQVEFGSLTSCFVTPPSSPRDGKWHLATGYINDTTKTIRCAYDGVWGAPSVGAGAYTSDANDDLTIGRRQDTTTQYLEGAVAWVELSDNDRHTAGTDFIPPRAAYNDGNTVEYWLMDEGTGGTAAAQITSPNNDGTITAGSWSRVWEQESTPVIQPVLECDGSTRINYGSGANIDDLHDNAMTAEVWACVEPGESNATLIAKGSQGVSGWSMRVISGGGIEVRVECATLPGAARAWAGIDDGRWHHIAFTWDDASYTEPRIWVDGVELTSSLYSRNGAVVTDAALSCWVGDNGAGTGYLEGLVAWHRLSDSIRYTSEFVPAGRSNCPANDANTHLLIAMTDGAGTTTTDTSGNGYNGTITMGNGRWWNSTDMENVAPGERVYGLGYVIGSDGANDGLTIIEDAEVTAATPYVVRAVLSVGMSSRAQPRIRIYDNTGAANVVDFDGPKYTGTHDGGAGAAALTDTTARWVQSLVGWTLYNITDGSSGTVTANTETTVTATLAGGGSNDWQVGETYLLRPPDAHSLYPWVETFVFTAPAGCTSIDVKVLNVAGEGMIHVHQVEVLESLADDGDMENLAGVPPIPASWTNFNLDPGDTVAENIIVHSGSQSIEWTTSASNEHCAWLNYATPPLTLDKFYSLGCWHYQDGVATTYVGEFSGATRFVSHADATSSLLSSGTDQRWKRFERVWRLDAAIPLVTINPRSGATGPRYTDDFYCIELADVSLTVTPSSWANSQEGGGVRVDGLDQCTSVPTSLTALTGWVRQLTVVRQDLADADEFDLATQRYVLAFELDVNNYMSVRLRPDVGPLVAELIVCTQAVVTSGQGNVNSWNSGETKVVDVRYTFPNAQLWVDGIHVVTVAMTNPFAGNPDGIFWGSGWGDGVLDSVVY